MSVQFYCCVFSCIDLELPPVLLSLHVLVVLYGASVLADCIDRLTSLDERSSLVTRTYRSSSSNGRMYCSTLRNTYVITWWTLLRADASTVSVPVTYRLKYPLVLRHFERLNGCSLCLQLIVSRSLTLLFLSASSRCPCWSLSASIQIVDLCYHLVGWKQNLYDSNASI